MLAVILRPLLTVLSGKILRHGVKVDQEPGTSGPATRDPPSKFKSGIPSPFCNELFFFRIFTCFLSLCLF